ncbi:MAG: hypothetical protein ABIA11_00320 [Patescibacteria group bacterium]|nr:hypothetical protein [Patescibacteria group bacterium]
MNSSYCNISIEICLDSFIEALNFIKEKNPCPPWLSEFNFSNDESFGRVVEEVRVDLKIYMSPFEYQPVILDRGSGETEEEYKQRLKAQVGEPKKNKREYEEFKKILGIP